MCLIKRFCRILILLLIFNSHLYALNQCIMNGNGGQIGDNVTSFCLARILSMKYKIPFYKGPFEHHELFDFYYTTPPVDRTRYTLDIHVQDEFDIISNLDKDNVLFWTDIRTHIDDIDPEHVEQVKKDLQLKNRELLALQVNPLPTNMTTVAVHIRKGNGGGQYYDGEQSSPQLFNFDRAEVHYVTFFHKYPFEWMDPLETRRPIDQVGDWQMRFPPEQFYIDQIIKLSHEYDNAPLFVQIFTDDRDPEALIDRIETAVNLSNTIFYYHNILSLPHKEKIALDLYSMTRHEVLIRPQSYYSRTAELIGYHKLVIYPVNFRWDYNRLIMNKVMWRCGIN